MTRPLVTEAMLADALARAGLAGIETRPGPAPLASPSYRALESASVIVAAPEGAIFLKIMHPEMRDGFDLAAAMTLARQAGEAGVGPRVLWADPAAGAIAMRGLVTDDGWSTATQYNLTNPEFVATSAHALRGLHGTAPLAARFDPFARIDALIAEFGLDGADLPEDILWLRRLIARVEPLGEGARLAACRNDGAASNLMAGPAGAVMLIDYDRAGMNDPLYDLGALLAETTDFERDMRAGYTAYAGAFDEEGFARARLWSFVDDMLHALWSRLRAHGSMRGGIEWLKYGEWRLMRLRMALMHPQFEEKLRITGAVAG